MNTPSTESKSKAKRPKSAKRSRKNDISKYIGIIKSLQHVTDEELDEMRYKYLEEKYGPFPPPGTVLNLDHLRDFRKRKPNV